MTPLELWTRLAIVLLIGGSALVFAWFARDLARLERTWWKDAVPGDRVAPGGAEPGEQPIRPDGEER